MIRSNTKLEMGDRSRHIVDATMPPGIPVTSCSITQVPSRRGSLPAVPGDVDGPEGRTKGPASAGAAHARRTSCSAQPPPVLGVLSRTGTRLATPPGLHTVSLNRSAAYERLVTPPATPESSAFHVSSKNRTAGRRSSQRPDDRAGDEDRDEDEEVPLLPHRRAKSRMSADEVLAKLVSRYSVGGSVPPLPPARPRTADKSKSKKSDGQAKGRSHRDAQNVFDAPDDRARRSTLGPICVGVAARAG